TIHQLFEEQVKNTPDAIAVVYNRTKLTYKELNDSSNQLARHIQKHYPKSTVAPDTLIALCLDRSLDIVIGILAILKAGGAYVPLDSECPLERLRFQLEDTNTNLLLTKTKILDNIRAAIPSKVKTIAINTKPYIGESTGNIQSYTKPNDLAYVIYTSGTTGKPKGVMIEHRSVINLLDSHKNTLLLNRSSRVLQCSVSVFDIFMHEVFSTLVSGAGLYIVNEEQRRDTSLLFEFIATHEITMAILPAALLNAATYRLLPSLTILVIGGDRCERKVMQNWMRGRRLINEYGPTEATVCTTIHEYQSDTEKAIIGKPLHNVQTYALDSNLLPMPLGSIGELYIGGAGLARGYLNQPKLTKECFIDNPFDDGRIYKTGDLVRYLPDGNLEYIGRNDFQVKIRGYRIELGEIESVISTYHKVKQSAAIAHQKDINSPTQLTGYYVGMGIDEESLRSHLESHLPKYMLPHALICLYKLPLNINGKLDRKSLPRPDYTEHQAKYIAPRTSLEKSMCEIWQSVLGLERVGLEDDFFKLGGNSILATSVISRANQILNTNITVADLFRYTTIDSLSTLFNKNKENGQIIKFMTSASIIQERIHFIHPIYAGCEFYRNLTEKLTTHYSTLGIDNGYAFYGVRENTLSGLANHYLSLLNQFAEMPSIVRLLGYSTSGIIALEMAYLLEQRGIKDIQVFLLDTHIHNNIEKSGNIDMMTNHIKKTLKNAESTYVDSILKQINTIMNLSISQISGMLLHTKVILFRATQGKDLTELELANNKVRNLTKQRVHIVCVDCSHEEIITHVDTLSDGILKFG
ncbi:MAG: amino acid adenylation domain-containing protein, partial [Legionellaceae bacterium]|nr:amino acid adenylation domain-containing protein [Legionellaceae bacterium]